PEWRNNLYKFADTGLTTDASGLFQIDAQTGQITTTRAVVGTDAGQKTLHVVAYDGSLVGPTKDYVFTIAAADAPPPVVDPIAPVVVGGSVSIQENALAYAAVANVRPAGVVGDTVTYALVLNPGAKFG
ncbi:hypothetical protein AB4072_17175, partial [Microvirga sp. 2MCAF38]|uniref:hypothetical protein n=1 Tax=Microvirga sp. 2MCAF38 TaxID=3232989 RepID=UPI003F97C4AD